MNKKNSGIRYMAFVFLGLILLILGIFFYVAFGETPAVVQTNISVILYSAGNDGWESLREGIKQAQDDFSVNANIVILQKDADAKEQLEIMKREVQNGAKGLAVAVADDKGLYELMQKEEFSIPIVTVESGFEGQMFSLISADNYEMGRRLGEEILNDFPQKDDLTIALVDNQSQRNSVLQRKEGLLDALEGKAEVFLVEKPLNGENADAAVALCKETLLKLCNETSVETENMKVYGIGNTSSIVAALDQGHMEKLVFQNEFNIGYLAVESLLEDMGSITKEEEKKIEFYCVSNKELYDTQYERLLFPIVE